jgi:hypothetical protein
MFNNGNVTCVFRQYLPGKENTMDQKTSEKSPDDLRAEQLFITRLASGPGLEDIHAWVAGGVATVTGRVRDEVDILRVSKIAETVPGISQIENLLEVDPTYQPIESPVLEVPDVEAANTINTNLPNPTPDIRPETNVAGEMIEVPGVEADIIPVAAIPGTVPVSADPAGVMDAGAVDALQVSGGARDADDLAYLVKEGMDVLDSEGKKVGKVKTIRQTDFLISRLLARSYYVPYFECSLEEDHVRLNKVKASEINDQGWAFPV